ncbi:MAG TPA: GNAT family N-acetyltransferase [Fimbriimonadaceae bacterium]|nr:GNAT family N-acetyltransferase [Fimbriimonadaceae bacterium]
MIFYSESLHGITPSKLRGFHADWASPPSSEKLFRMMRGSHSVVLAIDEKSDKVVGYAAALSDGHLFAFVSSIEVLPAFRGKGIGTELMRRMLARYSTMYGVDLLCDEALRPFYEKFQMKALTGMALRRYDSAA